QDLARMGVDDDGASAGGAMFENSGAQLAFGNVLEILVECQLDGGARCGRTLVPTERVTPGVGLNEDGSGLAANLLVVGVLEAAQAVVVDSDVPEQMRGQLLVWIEPPRFLEKADGVQVQRGDTARLIGRDLTPNEGKGLRLPEAFDERLAFLLLAITERGAES